MSRIVAAALLAVSLACAKSGERVVVYTSVDDVFARPIAERYEATTGVAVLLVPDTEETKSTGLLNRLIAEQSRPQADVFWSGDPMRVAVLEREGITAPYRSAAAEGLPTVYSDPDAHWTGFSARARVLVYHRERVATPPTSVLDLLDTRFRGQACLANPLFGTTSMHAAALFVALGDERARAFFEGFLENGGRMVSSNSEVRRRVAAGDCAVGITDTDDANVARIEGQPLDVVYPDRDGIGTLVIPNAVALIRGAPHPEEGQHFIDFLLSPEVETELARSEAAQMPLRPDVTPPDGVPAIESLAPMRVDYTALAVKLEELSTGYLADWAERAVRAGE
jgi:iron(III) transport system substrate-binding protein